MSESNSVKVHVFNRAIEQALEEVDKWTKLVTEDYEAGVKEGVYANPGQAKLSHKNQRNLLGAVRTSIAKLKINEVPCE